MRTKTEFKRIAVRKDIYDRLKDDTKHFEEMIGGGRWSLSDTITEYLKIMPKRKGDVK